MAERFAFIANVKLDNLSGQT